MKGPNGVRTMADIMDRCRIDDETGCWVWAYAARRNMPRIWIADLRTCLNGGAALHWLQFGKKPPKGKLYIATCGNTLCMNPEHRRMGTQRTLQKMHSADQPQESRARMALTHRKRTGTPVEVIEAVRAATGTLAEIGAAHGMSQMRVWRIRTGQRWGALHSASVFNYRP